VKTPWPTCVFESLGEWNRTDARIKPRGPEESAVLVTKKSSGRDSNLNRCPWLADPVGS